MTTFGDSERLALANICRAASAKFREDAERVTALSPSGAVRPYPEIREALAAQAAQAEEFAAVLADFTNPIAFAEGNTAAPGEGDGR